MKVLFQIRSGYKDGPAGDSIQMLKTKMYLEKQGVDIVVSSRPDVNMKDFDLIHIFNCTRLPEAYSFYKNAIIQKKKIVITPIFIDMHWYYRNSPARLAAWRAENIMRREMLQGCHMLLPNSQLELQWIKNILFVDTPAKIIYHGVDPLFFAGDENWFYKKYGLKDFILCAGRLSPIKNQLSLIRAVKGMGIPIVLIGPVNNKAYALKCAEESEGCVKYIPELSQNELASAYRAALVHVQPSWFETAGLASLEAAASGTPVVITSRGAAQEYFGNMAVYVEPDSLDSISNGVRAAMQKGGNLTELQSFIKERFSWEKAAQDTLIAYREVVEGDYQPGEKGAFYSQTYNLPGVDKK
ncbi:MAG TPA: glycosyltransferase family 4 protein [Clostridiales bacterium]|nr:glycosyltransferase family 4 protein [Clostridiales bacterium]